MIKQLKDALQGMATFYEGADRLTSREPNYYEVRLDGPYYEPCGTRGEYKASIEVNILINTTRNEKYLFLHANLKGIAASALSRDYCIYRIGNVGKEDSDDQSFFEVMTLIGKDQIKVSEFGMIDTNTEVFQAVAEAHYEMRFSTF
jgi:hypothetical protein